jgi:hypothetical protein
MPGEVLDGFIGLGVGMNAVLSPTILPLGSFARGINLSARGALVHTRPGFVQESLKAPAGVFQGAGVWSLESGDRIAFVVAGVVYVWVVDTAVLHTVGTLLDATAQCYFVQAERYMIIQDGSSDPVLLQDNSGTPGIVPSWEYASPDDAGTMIEGPSVPPGFSMVFAHGRIHMVPTHIPNTVPPQEGRATIISGDIQLPSAARTLLEFVENDYLSEGGANGLPLELGFVGGLGVVRNAATGTGAGEVVAIGRNGVVAFDFSIPRSMWKTQPLSKVLFTGPGTKSPWAVLSLNDDLIYRGLDGLRALRYTMSQTAGGSGALSNTPLSFEVDTFLEDDGAYLRYVSATACDNRLFLTAGGLKDRYFRGMISWDVAAAFYNGSPGPGAYDGLWTGFDMAQVLTALRAGVPTAFVFGRGPVLYSVDPDASVDTQLDGTRTRIQARVHTAGLSFQDPFQVKKLRHVELWLSGIREDTDIVVYYRPGGYPLWQQLGTRGIKVAAGSLPQVRRRVRVPLDFSQDSCDATTGEPLYSATAFEFAIQWTGCAKIERFRASAEPVGEAPADACSETESKLLSAGAASGVTLADDSYSIGG